MKTHGTIEQLKEDRVCRHGRAVALLVLALTFLIGLTIDAVRASEPTIPPVFSNPLSITNEFHPFQPGGLKIFTGMDDGKRATAVDQYLTETREFSWNQTKVECRILREFAFEAGELIEVSDNYFAQADDGTVFYFGEVVDNYEDGVIVDHGGSWLVGGATLPTDPINAGNAIDPTVFMPANPELGDTFKPEDLFPIVDETGKVIAANEKVRVPADRYEGAIIVKESSQLSPATERKWYAPGVGVVKVKGKNEILRLEASTLVQVE